jgi:hypothetical protein
MAARNQLALDRVLSRMARSQVVASIALALLLASGCQQEERRSCPVQGVSRVRLDVRAVAFAYGDGPVYVGLGSANGVVRYTVDTQKHGGWYYYKTLWAIAPGYTGGVVISGSAIGSNALLRFSGGGFPGKPQPQLRFRPDDSGKWRYGPSDTLIRAAGCYVFHIEGEDFEQSIAFRATD